MKSFDGAYYDRMQGGIYAYPVSPAGLKAEQRDTPFRVFFNLEHSQNEQVLHPLPLGFKVHNPTPHPKDWYMHSLYYLNQGPFNTADELMTAYNEDTIRKIKLRSGYRGTISEKSFPKTEEPIREGSSKAGSQTYEPAGKRYSISDHTVSWLGWNVSVTTSQWRGPALYDIRFKGERIIYENSVQDVALAYSADDSIGMSISFY